MIPAFYTTPPSLGAVRAPPAVPLSDAGSLLDGVNVAPRARQSGQVAGADPPHPLVVNTTDTPAPARHTPPDDSLG